MLRRMGYTVRPVIGKTNRWAGKQKDNIDQLQFKHNMQPFQSHHGDFSAQMPGVPMDYSQGNITEYFYPDMANGAYYKVTRLPYYGSFSNQTASHVLNRIDSLLFENIPNGYIDNIEIININGEKLYSSNKKIKSGEAININLKNNTLYIIKYRNEGLFYSFKTIINIF
jgi:hypothetical protein